MSMKDFPPAEFPEGVNCKQQEGFSIDFIRPTIEEGRCQVCHNTRSTVVFDIGITHHHLCRSCFDKMMKLFTMKINSVLIKKVECTGNVSGHFEIN